MIDVVKHPMMRLVLLASLALSLFGCGGGSSSSSSSASPASNTQTTTLLAGSVGDGPIVGADIFVYDKNGNLVGAGTSDSQANFSINLNLEPSHYPITIEAIRGTDLVSGTTPDFTLRSVALSSDQSLANLNPYSTLVVEIAQRMNGGINDANISTAINNVIGQLNFGLDETAISNPITIDVGASTVGNIVKSSEALSEMVRRTRDTLIASGDNVVGDDIIDRLAADLTDGVLDSNGAAETDPRTTAVAITASSQVLIETLSNNLQVNGAEATTAMDMAIATILPGATESSMTGNVTISRAILTQTAEMLDAISAAYENDVALIALGILLDTIPADSQPSAVEEILPATLSANLDDTLVNVAAASDAEIEAINSGTPIVVPDQPGNSAPTISGTPAGTIAEDSNYSFTPSAADTDGDSLSFSIVNQPAWADFDSTTGALSGIPRNVDVGSYSNIIITVSDGTDSASIGPFNIQVSNTNDAPSISGSPSASAVAGVNYSFTPNASDLDGDSLSFSITNKPAWASFDTSTGRLSGTPATNDAGSYANIRISVTDGTVTVSLTIFSITVSIPTTDSATITWTAPSTREDGTALSLSEITGYKIYYGTAADNYTVVVDINDVSTTQYTISSLTTGTYYFAVTTIDTDGRESLYSTNLSKTVN